MTLKFNTFLEVFAIHARAKFHQAECSGSECSGKLSFYVWTQSWSRRWRRKSEMRV